MTRKKQMLLALSLAGLLVILALVAGLGRPREAVTTIVSLRRDVKAGVVLKPEDLMMVSLPARLANGGYILSLTDAAGKACIHDLRAGQLLESSWLRARPDGIAYPDAAPDSRLYTLSLRPEHANGFWLAAGNRVDVHLVPRSDGPARSSQLLPEVLPGVRIAALIGTSEAGSASLLPAGQTGAQSLVCLAVTAAEARILALAEMSCLVKLVPLNEPVQPDNDGPDQSGIGPGILEASDFSAGQPAAGPGMA